MLMLKEVDLSITAGVKGCYDTDCMRINLEMLTRNLKAFP
jgi:hypothetical protein